VDNETAVGLARVLSANYHNDWEVGRCGDLYDWEVEAAYRLADICDSYVVTLVCQFFLTQEDNLAHVVLHFCIGVRYRVATCHFVRPKVKRKAEGQLLPVAAPVRPIRIIYIFLVIRIGIFDMVASLKPPLFHF